MNTSQNTHLIAIEKLEKSPLNVRRTVKRDGLDELKASILAHGLMQNLVVTEIGDEKFRVIAGGRRLEALRALKKEGKLPGGFAVPCQVVTEEHAKEMSLAENTVRVAMHPADEFEAFAELVESGKTTAEVAERFGVSEKQVLQRLRLGRVAPKLLKEYRAETINLDCLMAFAITDDQKRQLKVYNALQDWQKTPHHIRALLTEKLVAGDSKRSKFVGRESYEAAGGRVRTDLFGENVYLEDPELLNRLAAEKLDGIRRGLEAEGWGWIEVSLDLDSGFVGQCRRIHSALKDPPAELLAESERLQKELRDIEDAFGAEEIDQDKFEERSDATVAAIDDVKGRISAYLAFDPGEMKVAGCYLSIDHDGQPSVKRGLVRKQDWKKLAKANPGEQTETSSPSEPPKEQVSTALRRDLEAYRLEVAKVAVAEHPEIALDLLVFHVASELLTFPLPQDGPDVRFSRTASVPSVEGKTIAAARFEAIEKKLPTTWLKPKTEARRFEEFRKLKLPQKLALLAFSTASTLKATLATDDPKQVTAYEVALSLTGARVSDSWRPSRENYLGRVTREQLLILGRELFGDPWVHSRRSEKKGKLVDELHKAFSNPERHPGQPEELQKLKQWLPAGMAFQATAVPTRPARRQKRTQAA